MWMLARCSNWSKVLHHLGCLDQLGSPRMDDGSTRMGKEGLVRTLRSLPLLDCLTWTEMERRRRSGAYQGAQLVVGGRGVLSLWAGRWQRICSCCRSSRRGAPSYALMQGQVRIRSRSSVELNWPECTNLPPVVLLERKKTDGCKTISPTDCGFQIGMTTFTFFLQRQVSEVYLPWHFLPDSLKGFLNNGKLCRALRSQRWDSLLQIEKRIGWRGFLLNATLLQNGSKNMKFTLK